MADITLSTISVLAPQNRPDSLDGRVINIANGDLGNADTSYLYFGLGKDGYNIFSLQYTITATTLTIECSNSSASVADSSAIWSDLTTTLTGAASLTATGTLTVTSPFLWSRVRIKRVTTNATNALAINLTRGRAK